MIGMRHGARGWLTSRAELGPGVGRPVLRRFAASALLPFALYACGRADPATPFEVGKPGMGPTVLIATESTPYKDSVVRGLVDELRPRVGYIRVADVSMLPSLSERDWDAIVVLHGWRAGRAERHARAFVDGSQVRDKLVVLTTSSSGDEKMPGVDAISAASEVERAPADAHNLVEHVERILAAAAVPNAAAAQ